MNERDRAAENPLNGTDLKNMDPGVAEIVKQMHGIIQKSLAVKPYLWVGSGYRENTSEHASGRAVDVIITANVGDTPTDRERWAGNQFVDWLISHADELGVYGIVFSRDSAPRPEYWGYSHPGSWKTGKDEGGVSHNHMDHVHVWFEEGATWPESLTGSFIGPPGLPNVGDDGSLKVVDTVSVSHLREARYSDPDKEGTPVGPYGNEVYTLETALAKTEWILWDYVDGHYGTSTVGDGSSGYGGTTGFQRKHSGASDPDGWLGQQELTTLFRLAGMSVSVTD